MKILQHPDPMLCYPCKPVVRFEGLGDIANEMVDTMRKYRGLGLAAPQVGIPLRMFALELGHGAQVFVNPKLYLSPEFTIVHESCLSILGAVIPIQRALKATIVAFNANSEVQQAQLEGIEAVAAQHEADHLDGITIISRAHYQRNDMHPPGINDYLEKYCV